MTMVRSIAAVRQATLLNLLACPQCQSSLSQRDPTFIAEILWGAELYCDRCQSRVGVVLESKPSFLERDFDRFESSPTSFKVDGTGDLVPTGQWSRVPEGWMSLGDVSDALTLDHTCDAMSVTFYTHNWSGKVELGIDGVRNELRDLYSPTPGELTVELRFDETAPHRLAINPVGSRSQLSYGDQVIVKSVHVWVDADRVPVPEFVAVDRGNPYPPYFVDLLTSQAPEAVVLDAGGGDRQIGD